MSLKYRYNKKFLNDLSQIPKKQRLKIETFVFSEVMKYKAPNDIPNLNKLKGYTNYYKIRFGNYRAGIRLTENILIFERILHRKELYKFYP